MAGQIISAIRCLFIAVIGLLIGSIAYVFTKDAPYRFIIFAGVVDLFLMKFQTDLLSTLLYPLMKLLQFLSPFSGG